MHYMTYWNRWGGIQQIHVPDALFQNKALVLQANSLAVLLVLLHIYKNKAHTGIQPTIATVRVGQEKLIQRTGYSRNIITKAVEQLENARFVATIPHRKKRKEFGANEYILRRPDNGDALLPERSLMVGNGLGYFTFPACVIKEHEAHWSLANMTASELSVYASVLWLANRRLSNKIQIAAADLRGVSRLSAPTFKKALDALQERGLLWVSDEQDLTIEICDPYTGEPLRSVADKDNAANYYAVTGDGREKRLNLNLGDPKQVEELIRSCLPPDEKPVVQGNGDLKIRCPIHTDDNPSCSVSPKKNGCFNCFGCGNKGSLTDLVMRLRNISRGEAVQQIGKAFGAAVTYRDPDRNADAIYDWCDANGKLLKQTVWYPRDADGQKVIRQRRPAKGGGWIWNVKGVPTSLFNMDMLEVAGVVCITEGEKDARKVTELRLLSTGGILVVGVTSGGAESWEPQFAKSLHGKQVIVMPDADDPGQKFKAEVIASLQAEGIGYRVVTFDDVGENDVTDFLKQHSVENLVRRMGTDWVRMPEDSHLHRDVSVSGSLLPHR